MRSGDGRERSPADAFPRGTKGMVMVFSPRGRAVSFGQEDTRRSGRGCVHLQRPLVAATAVRVRLKAFGATGVRRGWSYAPRKTGPELTVGERARKFGDNYGRMCGT
jgi:hypothetical protein